MEGKQPCYFVSDAVYRTGNVEADTDFRANGFRLPLRNEWEYAARGGLMGNRFPWGDLITAADASYAASQTSICGSYPANAYGLHDVAGNVWEWCNDVTGDNRRGRAGGGYTSSEGWLRCGAPADGESLNLYHSLGFRALCH